MLYPPSIDLTLFSCSHDAAAGGDVPSSSMQAAVVAGGPLSPKSSSSSSLPCGMQERLVMTIQRHHQALTESFSWSDFPIVHQQQDYHRISISSKTTGSATLYNDDPLNRADVVVATSTEEDPGCMSSSSSCSSSSSDDTSVCSSIGDMSLDAVPSHEEESSPYQLNATKRVQFSSTLEVRTYSIVLGDHPFCRVLPIELGWDYTPEPALVDLDTHEEYKCRSSSATGSDARATSSSSSSLPYVHRRSYLERKDLLLTVGNMSEEEVRDAETRGAPTRRKSTPSSPPSRYSTSHSDLCALLEQPRRH
jgi:hypothetical protein